MIKFEANPDRYTKPGSETDRQDLIRIQTTFLNLLNSLVDRNYDTRGIYTTFEIEQEKLYTVEIPNPNRPDIVTLLYKENGKVFIGNEFFWDEVPNYKWKNEPEYQLTEAEIKQDFEWAWDAGFAKPVEEIDE